MKTEVCFYCRWVTQELIAWLVGKIQCQTDPLVGTQHDDPLDVGPPTSLPNPGGIEHETTNGMVLPEHRFPRRPAHPLQSVPGRIQEVTTDAGGSTTNIRRSIVSRKIYHPLVRLRFQSLQGLVLIRNVVNAVDNWLTSGRKLRHLAAGHVDDQLDSRIVHRIPPMSLERCPSTDFKSLGQSRQDYYELAQRLRALLPLTCRWLEPGDVRVTGVFPVSGGGSADIWEAYCGNQMVAIKSYRLYDFDRDLRVSCDKH